MYITRFLWKIYDSYIRKIFFTFARLILLFYREFHKKYPFLLLRELSKKKQVYSKKWTRVSVPLPKTWFKKKACYHSVNFNIIYRDHMPRQYFSIKCLSKTEWPNKNIYRLDADVKMLVFDREYCSHYECSLGSAGKKTCLFFKYVIFTLWI